MEAWIAFGRGPLFRLSFTLMLLGLARIFVLAFIEGMKQVRQPVAIHEMSTVGVWRTALEQVGIIGKLWWWRPLHSLVATLFHVGFIVAPLFVAAHVIQWRKGVGFSWWELPQGAADRLTLLVIVLAPLLVLIRGFSRKESSGMSRQAALRPLLLVIPFITGYICVNGVISPDAYYTSMLIHVWAGNILMLAIPFTTVADCILKPMSEVSSAAGSKFALHAEPLWATLIGTGGSK